MFRDLRDISVLTLHLEKVGAFEMNKILSKHIFKPEEVGEGGVVAVSYTHLDVYKRQT